MQGKLEPARWLRQKAAFQEALDLDPHARDAMLARLRAEDAALADAVAAMLAAHEADDGALDEPALAPRPADPVIGLDVDGKYRIEHRLGRGGMGSVYRATHLWTGRAVAVKIIAPEFVRLPEFVERFKREARAAGRLRHPNVVNVTDFGFTKLGEGRLAYLVMEYLDGRTLGDVLAERGPLPLGFAVEVIEQTCLAVDAAHASGVLHRDLKPDNIWLEPDGRGGFTVKVLDFGIARLRETGVEIDEHEPRPASAMRDATRPTRRLPWAAKGTLAVPATPRDAAPPREPTAVAVDARTVPPERSRASMVLGTPAYMSPEQCRGDGADERSDVYGLGIVAYEMLAGSTPFSGDLETLLIKHGEMPPPPLRSVRRDLPRPVEAVVRGALAKSRDERPPTAGAFAASFAAAARGERFLEREAAARLAQHRLALWRLRLRARALFVALAALAVVPLSTTWLRAEPPALMVAVLWLVPLALVTLASDFGAAACALALERPPSGAAADLEIEDHSTRLWRRAHLVAAAAIRGLARPAGVFAATVAAAESASPSAATARSRRLAAIPGSFATQSFLRRFATSLVVLLCMAACSATVAAWFAPVGEFVPLFLLAFFVAAMAGLVCGAILSRSELARAALYLSARRSAGDAIGERTAEVAPLGGARERRGTFRTPALVASCLVAVLAFGALEFLVVPPLAPVEPYRAPRAAAVAPEENAWTEYNTALKRVEIDVALRDQFQSQMALTKFATGEIDALPPDLLESIDRNAGTLDHVVRGAQRPTAFFIEDSNPDRWPGLSYTTTHWLTTLAAARSRVAMDAGRESEARTLLLSAYRLAVDVGAAPLGQTSFLMSAGDRWLLLATAARWASAYPKADHLALARGIEALDARVEPLTSVLADSDERTLRNATAVTFEGRASAAPYAARSSTFDIFPGLQLRTYREILALVAENAEAERRAVEAWDAEAAIALEARCSEGMNFSTDLLRLDRGLAKQALANSGRYRMGLSRTMRLDYETRALDAGTRALLACAAYARMHGAYPATIDEACVEAGMEVPKDPITGLPARYRVENGAPVVWLSGIDRVDDGGARNYVDDEDPWGRGVPGTDVVCRLGTPFRRP